MCTVTYLPKENGDFIFTSNRDEQASRETLFPEFYKENGVNYLYPKDKKAGGTWIALSEEERLVCLLNGAYENHEAKVSYAYSRGLVVKEVLQAENVKWAIEDLELDGVEPFTLIAIDWSFLTICIELIWDGVKKDIRILSNQSKIWSSSTLYSKPIKAERESWFVDFMTSHPDATQKEILEFHLDDSLGTKETSIKMKRPNVETLSVTSIVKSDAGVTMYYQDVLTGIDKNVDLFSLQD
ncbi:NRDE family protein [Flavicella sediminum]|uniref:NRDE family protein n=1 Tax=Flavicella sediminum TaxID=2585141 RepID=UPI00111DAB3E|nr:NRDE family protein [Flavicella sediminum]